MASVRWTRDALNEVEEIGKTVGVGISPAADLFVQSIYSATERLALFPNSGRVVPEIFREDVREVIVGSYRVFYLVRDNDVWILAVRHGARRFG